MAKKEKFTSGSFDLDVDLDFDNFDFGDKPQKTKKDRHPVLTSAKNFAKGSIGGLKSAATDRAKIAKAIRAGMPREYGEIMDRTGDFNTQLSSLYNDAATKIKPELQKITKQVDKLVPEEMKRTKGILSKIKKTLGVDDKNRFETDSEEARAEGMMQAQLAEVFAVQAEDSVKSRAEDRAERKIKDKVDAKRFESSFGLLNSINVNMARMSNYTTKVNSAFQKKSLELQYRSYFVQQDLLKTTKALAVLLDERTEAIQKNTGLPDFVKRTKSEDFREMTRRKMMNAAGGFLGRGVKNLVKAGKDKMETYLTMLQQASLGLDMAVDAKEMLKTQKELSESFGMEDSGKSGMAGDLFASLGVDWAVNKLGKKIQKHTAKPGSKTSNALFNVLSALNNGERSLKNFRRNKLQVDYSAEGFKGKASNTAKDVLGNLIDVFLGGSKSSTYEKQFGHGLSKLHESAEFNNLTQKSITTIIPGFLSRIHGEIRALRTNQDPKNLLEYDVRKGRFSNSGRIEKETQKFLQNKINENGLGYRIDALLNFIKGDQKLSKGAEAELRKKLHTHTFNSDGFDVSDLQNDQFTSGMNSTHKRQIRSAINKKFNKESSEFASNRTNLTKLGREAQNSIKDIDSDIQSLIDAGHENTLIKLRIIKKQGDSYTIAKDAFRRLSDAGFAKSDINAKENISSFNGSKALSAIKNSKIFNWFYKKGRGDSNRHTGPMAQTLKKQLGDFVAPGGKNIDLVSMNGVNMAAIQELDRKISNQQGGKNNKNLLLSIEQNTRAILERLDAMGHLTFGIPKLDAKGLEDGLKKFKNKFSEKFEEGKEYLSEKFSSIPRPKGVLGHAGNIAMSAGAILGKVLERAFNFSVTAGKTLRNVTDEGIKAGKELYKTGKDPVLNSAKWLFEKGTNLVGRVFDTVSKSATDILQNKLPAGWNHLVKVGKWMGSKALNFIDPPRDIYIPGLDKPVLRAILMRAGGYFDQITKKPIFRPSDIKGPVIDHEGNVVLSIDDIEAGLYDGEGKPIKSIMKHLADFGLNVAGNIKNRLSGAFKRLKIVGKGIGNTAKNAADNITGRFGFGNKKAVSLLTEIRDILNERLPGNKRKFISLSDRPTNKESSQKETGHSATDGLPTSGTAPNVVGGLMSLGGSLLSKAKTGLSKGIGSLSRRFGASRFGSKLGGWKGRLLGRMSKLGQSTPDEQDPTKPEKEEGEKPTLFQSLMRGLAGGGALLANGKAAPTDTDIHNIHAAEGKREGGIEQQLEIQRAREEKRKAETKVAVADNAPRYKGANVFDLMMEKAQGAFGSVMNGLGDLADLVFGGGKGGKGKLLSRGKGLLARGGGKLMGAGRAILGSFGKGGAVRGIGSGIARFGASTLARVGIGALASGGAATATAGAGAAGTAAVGTAAGTAAAGGAAAAGGGGLVALLCNPITLGIAATVALGYGIYKGYKYLNRNKASPETEVRMMQYGFRHSESTHYHSIYQLESEILENGIVFQQGRPILDKSKLNLKNVLEIFDLTEETVKTEGQGFLSWFSNRFKPVFLNHLAALHSVDPKRSLAEIDKLKEDDLGKFDRYFKIATNTPDIYQYIESPFKDIDTLAIVDGNAVQKTVKDIRDEYKDKLDPDGKVKDGLLASSMKKFTSLFGKNEGLEKTIKEGGLRGRLARVATFIPGVVMGKNLFENTFKMTGKLILGVKRFLTNSISPLEAVRFKTYGIKQMKHNQVSSIRNLEDTVSEYISITGGQAAFKGDVADIIKKVGSEFGISSPSDKQAESWMKWFSNRFLPVFISFISSGAQLTGKKIADEIEPSLKDSQKYDIALRLAGTSDVWKQLDSPWADEPLLNDNPDECKDNLQLLKDKAGKEILNDPKASSREKMQRSEAIKNAMVNNTGLAAPEKPAYDISKLFNRDPEPVKTSSEGEQQKTLDVKPVEKQATVTQSKVPLAQGPSVDPSEGDQYIKMAKGTTLNGLNPEMLRNLKMMAAEYGKATGKSITINSGVRTYAEQEAQYKKDPSKAAKPGFSLHEFGLALDINSDILNDLDKLGLMRKYGFTRPVGGETWHTESAGIQVNIDKAKKDPNFASDAIKKSLGLGGGGYATVPNNTKGRRNPQLAMSLLNDGASGSAPASDKDKAKDALTPSSNIPKEESKTPAPRTVSGPPGSSTDTPKSGSAPVTKQASSPSSGGSSTPNSPQSTMAASNSANANYGKGQDFKQTEPGSLNKAPVDTGKPGDVKSIIAEAAKRTNTDVNTMLTFAAIESGLNPAAKAGTSSATGLYQFISSTWKTMISKYGRKYNLDASASPTDPMANALMGGEFLNENARAIASVKPNPTATDLYLAHFLGAGGAKTFLRANPSAIGADIMPGPAKANRPIFYDGSRPRTIAEIYNVLNNKVQKAAARFGINAPKTASLGNGSTSSQPATQASSGSTQPSRTTGASQPSTSASGGSSQPSRTSAGSSSTAFPTPNQGTVSSGTTGTAPPRSVITPPPSVVGQSAPVGVTQTSTSNMNIGGSDQIFGNIDSTLTKSLSVQSEILKAIQNMVSNAGSSEKVEKISDDLSSLIEKVSNTGNKPEPVPAAAIDLSRKIK